MYQSGSRWKEERVKAPCFWGYRLEKSARVKDQKDAGSYSASWTSPGDAVVVRRHTKISTCRCNRPGQPETSASANSFEREEELKFLWSWIVPKWAAEFCTLFRSIVAVKRCHVADDVEKQSKFSNKFKLKLLKTLTQKIIYRKMIKKIIKILCSILPTQHKINRPI